MTSAGKSEYSVPLGRNSCTSHVSPASSEAKIAQAWKEMKMRTEREPAAADESELLPGHHLFSHGYVDRIAPQMQIESPPAVAVVNLDKIRVGIGEWRAQPAIEAAVAD